MRLPRFGLWRPCFVLSALFILVGGPRHPRGTMAEMLGHHDWVLAHVLMLAGFVALLFGLILYSRGAVVPDRTRKWIRFAVIGTALQVVEMVMHTVSVVDHANLVAGRATPVLSTHLGLAVVFYPIFAATIVGLILAGMRDRSLGSPWIGWLGILGAVAHGAAAPLVILFKIDWARNLFPGVAVLALWLLLAALWPSRSKAQREPAAGGMRALRSRTSSEVSP
jgi:nitrate reductase NapE component